MESERDLGPLASLHVGAIRPLAGAASRKRRLPRSRTCARRSRPSATHWIARPASSNGIWRGRAPIVVEQYARIDACCRSRRLLEKSFAFRDRCMADNVHALLEAEGRRRQDAAVGPQRSRAEVLPTGWSTWAASCMPSSAPTTVIVGFAFNRGSFQAHGRQTANRLARPHGRAGARRVRRCRAGGDRHPAVCARPHARAGRQPGGQVDGGQAVAANDRSGVRTQGRARSTP